MNPKIDKIREEITQSAEEDNRELLLVIEYEVLDEFYFVDRTARRYAIENKCEYEDIGEIESSNHGFFIIYQDK
jgi:hypothetical protein